MRLNTKLVECYVRVKAMTDLSSWQGQNLEIEDVITPAGVQRFYAALDLQPLPNYAENNLAPLGFHWCLCLPDTPLSELGDDGHPKKGGFLPPVPFPRRMWASAKTEFIKPLPIGQSVKRISTVSSINEKTGKSGSLVFVKLLFIKRHLLKRCRCPTQMSGHHKDGKL